MSSPFLVFPPKIPYPLPTPPCSPNHPLLFPGPGVPLCWAIETSQDQGPLLPLIHMHLEPWVPPDVLFA